MADKKAFHETIAEALIEQLKAGTAPWQRPWVPGEPGLGSHLPLNPTTGKRYKGANAINLLAQGHTDPRWMTYKQAAAEGAQVRKGEKGTSVQYWKFTEEQDKLDEKGKPVLDEKGDPVKVTVKLERPRTFFATVFNAEQIDNLPPLQLPQRPQHTWDASERAEHILQVSQATISHGANNAFYRPGTDSIHLPEKSRFPTADRYYATALHELGHWTGHESRLARDLSNPFGSEGYAREELRAEIASMFLGAELGIGHDPGQHAAYVASWIDILENDPLEILRASADAEKIYDYVMAFEREQQQSLDQQQNHAAPHELTLAEMSMELHQGLPEGRAMKSEPDPFSAENFASLVGVSKSPTRAEEIAENWTLKHLTAGTLDRALDRANIEQLDQVVAVLERMQPLVAENNFWARHPLPTDVDSLASTVTATHNYLTEQRRPDAAVAVALMEARADARAQAEFTAASEAALGFALPPEWTGEVRIVAVIERDGQLAEANPATETPDAYQLYARRAGAQGDEAFAFLAATATLPEADALVDRLVLIDANAETDYETKAAKFARIEEERVRRNPSSTDEDISAAKESRLAADAVSFAAEVERQQADQQSRSYINVPYTEKDEAKGLGAKWDRAQQSWFVPPGVDPAPFAKWASDTATTVQGKPDTADTPPRPAPDVPARVYLAVPYGERNAAKAAGAAWDGVAKSWYAGPDADMSRLARWKVENVPAQQAPSMTPREEFADALRSMGAIVSGEHPIMDGKSHRIPVEGDRGREQSGFYVGHLEDREDYKKKDDETAPPIPAGYIKNNRTGVDMKWMSMGYTMTPEEKARLQAQAAEKLAARAAERTRLHEATAGRVARELSSLVPVEGTTPYMAAKGIEPMAGVYTDAQGKTYVPAYDVDGKHRTTQYIQADGTKRFAKDSAKEGCFHPLGGMEALAAAPALVIAEGYATASTAASALGHATVAAFDSGNLGAVATALHQKYPDKPIIIVGDDDQHLPMTVGNNPGREKALQAARAVGGTAVFPVFAPGENTYPANLPPVTPAAYRAHTQAASRLDEAERTPEKVKISDDERAVLTRALLSPEQLAAIGKIKAHTDFNDVAQNSQLGKEGVERQLRAAVGLVLEKRQEQVQQRENQQKQNQSQQQETEQRRQRSASR